MPALIEIELRSSDGRKVCMTCHWFRRYAGAECIPVLTCQQHSGWTDYKVRQRGWPPEVG